MQNISQKNLQIINKFHEEHTKHNTMHNEVDEHTKHNTMHNKAQSTMIAP